MLTANITLAIFTMLGLSSAAVFWARRVRMPHTVFLVLVGMGLGLLTQVPGFSFFSEFHLTPELIFYLLLPTLIFESAYNINIRRLTEEKGSILVLSTVGLLVSTAIIGFALFFIFNLLGLAVPLIVTLLFGALISATDPVAVLALFKEFGAPRRLSLVFEGESLFNDATAVALFLIILDIMLLGFNGSETILTGIVSFISMMVGGILFGLLMGGLFSKIVGICRENEIASITFTIVLAHTTFILAEIISHHTHIGNFSFPVSPIIATTIAAMVMGNYGRAKIHPRAEEFIEKLWGQLAFMSNSLIFILIGLVFIDVPLFEHSYLFVVIITTVIVVAVARALSIYPVVGAYNLFADKERRIPRSWQHLLSWGSLRGALAISMVLLIPADATLPSWNLELSVRDFLLAITAGCIFATLFIKATTINRFMSKLKLNTLTKTEEVEYQEAKALIHHEVTDKMERYRARGYLSDDAATRIIAEHKNDFKNACVKISHLTEDAKEQLQHRVLRMFAIGIEKKYLKTLYHHNEVNEATYRKLQGKLQLQLEAVESGELAPNMSIHTDSKDIFDRIAKRIGDIIHPETEVQKITNLYMYYRAQAILSRKVVKELTAVDSTNAKRIFSDEALEHTISLYKKFKEQSKTKMQAIETEHSALTTELSFTLAAQGVEKIEEHILHDLFERELITQKLYITLREELLEKQRV